MLQQNWMESLSLWWTGGKAINHVTDYEDPIQLYGMHWLNNVVELQNSKSLLQDRYLELRYEDLVVDVRGSIEKIRKFAGLRRRTDYESLLPNTLTNMNYKWESDLSESQIELLEKTIGGKLRELGYSVL
jgi:hypothetical protein